MPSWDDRLLEALHAYGADEAGHSGRAPIEHVIGTADRLRAWLFCVCWRREFGAGRPGERIVAHAHASGAPREVAAVDEWFDPGAPGR